jgi:hypothetical protein
MKTAACGRCNGELVERPGLPLIRFFECLCGATVEIRVELIGRSMIRRLCLLGGEARIPESTVEKFFEKYREGVRNESCNLCESEHVEQWARPNHADTRAARVL